MLMKLLWQNRILDIDVKLFGYQAREKIISKINKIIEVQRQNGPPKEGNNGVLGRLIEEDSLPDDAVADFIINLLFAGNETTTKTMLFAVYFLTQCPNAMEQLLVCIIVKQLN